jgi:hypothetical protein
MFASYPVVGGQPYFSSQGTSFEDLRIAGGHTEISVNQELYGRPRTYDDFLNWHDNAGHHEREQVFRQARSHGPIITSLVSELKAESQNRFRVDGNVIDVPNFGRIRFAELVIERERRALTMLHLELGGEIQGEINLATLVLNGISDRTTSEREWAAENALELVTDLDEKEEAEVLGELKQWVNTHPRQEEPFLFFMGRSLTPSEFFHEVEEKTAFGIDFLRFLAEQSKSFDQRPRDAIRRAVDANRAE